MYMSTQVRSEGGDGGVNVCEQPATFLTIDLSNRSFHLTVGLRIIPRSSPLGGLGQSQLRASEVFWVKC